MKKLFIISILMLILTDPALAGELYVKSIKAKILSMPSFKSEIVEIASRGTVLEEIKRKGKWVMVSFRGKEGWLSRYVVSKKPPMKRVSLLARGESIKESARRRASAFTSVAAARGLTDYERLRKSRKNYAVDYGALERMERIEIDEAEALKFVEEGVGR